MQENKFRPKKLRNLDTSISEGGKKIQEQLYIDQHPIETSNFLRTLSLSYMNPIVKACKSYLVFQNMNFPLPTDDTIESSQDALGKEIKKGRSIATSLFTSYKLSWVISIAIEIFVTVFKLAVVFVSKELLTRIQNQIREEGKVYDIKSVLPLVIFLFLNSATCPILESWVCNERARLSLRFRVAMIGLSFEKMLKIGVINPNIHDEGSIINYLQNDCTKFEGFPWSSAILLNSVFNLVLTMIVGIWLYEYTFVTMIACLGFIAFLNAFVFKYWLRAGTTWTNISDERIAYMKNVFKNLNFVKIKGWEDIFYLQILKVRKREMKYYTFTGLCHFLFLLLLNNGNTISLLAFLTIYLKYDGILDVPRAATVLMLFNIVRDSFIQLPMSLGYFLELSVSLKRLQRFFDSEELESCREDSKLDDSKHAIEIKNGHFYWDLKKNKNEAFSKKNMDLEKKKRQKQKKRQKKQNDKKIKKVQELNSVNKKITESLLSQDSQSTLDDQIEQIGFAFKNLNFVAKKKELTMILGKIGSGKTSLLYAILGEMKIEHGFDSKISINGKMTYLGQKPWLINGTVKENIIMDLPYDEERLAQAIHYSCLMDDIKGFDKGLDNVLGEDGVTVSGGQKARIGLARCIYQE